MTPKTGRESTNKTAPAHQAAPALPSSSPLENWLVGDFTFSYRQPGGYHPLPIIDQPTITSASPLGAKIVAAAEVELGHGEVGYDNQGPDVHRYKAVTHHITDNKAWCADFASYILHKTAPGLIDPTSLAMKLKSQFAAHHAFFAADSDYKPKPGDLILFGAKSNVHHGHVGFVTGVDADGTVHTIEGNKAAPEYKNLKEGVDYQWSADCPDQVRRVSYTKKDFAELKYTTLLGYGSVDAMAEHAHEPKAPHGHGHAHKSHPHHARGKH